MGIRVVQGVHGISLFSTSPIFSIGIKEEKKNYRRKKAIIDFTLTSYNTALGRVKILSESQSQEKINVISILLSFFLKLSPSNVFALFLKEFPNFLPKTRA